ncbi:AraC family transcriptional regulator [Paenibacillus sp. IHB B 3415]|nr:AraC family transcriptional regulator [Paenibacillus sp. IHB B 3415]
MLGSGREKEMLGLLREILDAADISPKNIGYLEEISRALNDIVFDQTIQSYGKEESTERLQRYNKVSDLYQFSCFQDYYREVESLFLLLDGNLQTLKSVQIDNKEMKQAIQYIHENYAQNINMTIISNLVSFNYSYFSQAFRDYTGENFVNYLKKVRIGKAKQLLQATDDMIYEIAKKSGFENTKNFNRVFKESEGVSPVEYRNQQKVLSASIDQ